MRANGPELLITDHEQALLRAAGELAGWELVPREYRIGERLRKAKLEGPENERANSILEGFARLSDALTDMATAGCAY